MATKDKEAQKGRLIPFKDFELTKFKVGQNSTVVTFNVVGVSDRDKTETIHAKPHPDLTTKMDELKLYMAERIGYMAGWNFARDHIKGNLDATKQAKAGFDEAKDNFKVTGVIWVKKDERVGVQITGSLKCPDGGSSRLDVPLIYLEDEEDGGLFYSEDVEAICDELIKEVYNLTILNKKYQSDVETEAKKADQPDLFLTPEEQANGGFDENGERDFKPSKDQQEAIDRTDVNQEEE